MHTIPDRVLSIIERQHPRLQGAIHQVKVATDDVTVAALERRIAHEALEGNTGKLSAMDAWDLAQCAYGGPWRGDWWTLERAADETGYDASHLRRLVGAGKLPALKRGKTWYVRRDALPVKVSPPAPA